MGECTLPELLILLYSFLHGCQELFGNYAARIWDGCFYQNHRKSEEGFVPVYLCRKSTQRFSALLLLAYFLTMIFYDFKRYLRALLKPSAMTAPSFTNSDKYCLVREGCKPIACAI